MLKYLFTFLLGFFLSISILKAQIGYQKIHKSSVNRSISPFDIHRISKDGVLIFSKLSNPNSGYSLIKIDTTGLILWNKQYDSYEIDRLANTFYEKNSKLLISGYRVKERTYPVYYFHIYPFFSVIKLNGTVLDAKIFGHPSAFQMGHLTFIKEDLNKNIVLGGVDLDTYDDYHWGTIGLFCKMDSLGNIIYNRKLYDTLQSNPFESFVNALDFPDSTTIFVGQYSVGPNSKSGDKLVNAIVPGNFFMKVNGVGDTIWTKHYIDNSSIYYSKTPPINLSFYTGLFGGMIRNSSGNMDMVWFTMDSSGTVTKGFTFDAGLDERIDKFIMCSDSSLLLCGSISDSTVIPDGLLIKTDLSGNVLWAKRYGQDNIWENIVNAVELLSGNLLILGTYISPVSGNAEMLLIKTDALGQSSYCDETNLQVTVTPFTMNQDTVSYSFRFINGPSIYSSSLNVSNQTFSSYDPCIPVSIKEDKSISKLKVFPNPARERIYLQSSGNTGGLFVLRDITGRVQISQALSPNFQQTEISLSNLASGVYFWEIICTNEERQTGKLVKE
jgi:hypothetical protein